MNKQAEKIVAGIGFIALFAFASTAQAALPPQAQNSKDLDVMVSYVRGHDEVLSTLQLIDFGSHTIFYGAGCRVEFKRKAQFRLPGWVGPAAPLVFKEKSCEGEK